MSNHQTMERQHTVIIGAGQAGLSVGYHLKRLGVPFLILEANARVGDGWRQRWDSLRLFTPSRYDALDGMRFPGDDFAFPTKDQMADYLESYAQRMQLPVRTNARVQRLSQRDDRFVVQTADAEIEAENVVVAMATFQQPSLPSFADQLSPDIVQLHSSEYKSSAQLQPGTVLIVGAGNSGAEIGIEVARDHTVLLSGRDVGEIPFQFNSAAARVVLSRLFLRFIFHRVLTINTPVGRRVRPKILYIGGPLIRTRSANLAAAGVERVPRVTGVRDGKPLLADDRTVDVKNIIWCTGFHPGFSWIDLPILDERGYPVQQRGVVAAQPGLYFVGLHFQYALSSTMIHGVGRDAAYIARLIATRRASRSTRVRTARAPSTAAT